MKSYISLTNYLEIEVISMGYYRAMKITAGEPPKQSWLSKYFKKPQSYGDFASDILPQDFFKVLAYFIFLPPSILSSLVASFLPRLPPFLSADTVLSLSPLSFLSPSHPFAFTNPSLPPPVPLPQAIVQTIFYCQPIWYYSWIQIPCTATFHPLLDYCNQEGFSSLSST